MSTSGNGGEQGATVNLLLRGDIDVSSAGPLYADLQRLSRERNVARVCIDFSAVDSIDSAGVAAVSLGRAALERKDKALELRNLSPTHRAAFELRPEEAGAEGRERPRRRVLEAIGARGRSGWRGFVELAELAVDTGLSAGRCLVGRERMPWRSIAEQCVVLGVDAVPIVALLSFLLGIMLAFQSAFQLSAFGAEIYTAELVGLGMVREFGAFIAAIILAGRSGAAIAAELGTMAVHEETDALLTMGISPVRFLVLPRMVAFTVIQPALSLVSMTVGILGGILIAPVLDLSWIALYHRMTWVISVDDVVLGLTKSLLFAWAIGLASCFIGLRTRGGATSVGASATKAVVTSIFFIVVIDSIVTTAWTLGRS